MVYTWAGNIWPLLCIEDNAKNAKAINRKIPRSGEFEEGRRGWKRCACLIPVSGTLSKRFSRKNTGLSGWEKARRVTAIWEAAGSWDGAKESVLRAPCPGSCARYLTRHD